MTWHRVGPVALTFLVAACTHDFDTFQPGGDGGGSSTDANTGDGGGTDSGAHDGAPGDSAGVDSSSSDAASDATAICTESGAITFGGHCYFLQSGGGTWDASRAACAAAGAHLVTIGSAGEQSAIAALAPAQERWIGLNRPSASAPKDSSYVWVTGEPRTYTNWDAGEPNGAGECVLLRTNGNWADNLCTTTFASICERD